ncbi:MAG TPA: DNA polymerase III subunit gamma and tau [Segeticoccus sp.]|uniref:DNA polymerase III subunit gamma and tau n=1 Tax=Segeticoccus sp. TaxID=2706531 RepID=UPI002D80D7DC|nr:DNA polymerase III subunit gamma and tau [Segeticoccus sp.]HET8598775.1 DNA polymerase III subunit gamma and tau [Segeticoccus sp.]
MTTALYRRYRPETFADVIGQEHVTEPLMQALRSGRIGHAYLFSGPRGCGKTTSARILARCLNCEQGPTPEPCGTCASCVALARGGPGSVDVIEIDAASHGGVDDARDLRERASYGPAQSRYKVYIIDEAHMVTPQGFNALLKIVEEPPEHVKFVFATTEPDKVIGTIRSRTHHYPFRLVPPQRLTTYMEQLCEAEGVAIEPGVLSFVVRAGGGSVRDSLSVLDQLIAGSGPEGLTYHGAAALLGFTDGELLDATVEGIAAGDAGAVFRQVDRVIESGHDPRRFVEDLLERLRDLIIIAAVPDGAASVLRTLPEDQLERMRQQAASMGAGTLSRAADIVNAGLTEMTGATAPRLQLELICARVLLPAASGEGGYAARLDRLERRLDMGSLRPPAAGRTQPVEQAGPAPRFQPPEAPEPPADRPDERPAASPEPPAGSPGRPAPSGPQQPAAAPPPPERPASSAPTHAPARQPERPGPEPATPDPASAPTEPVSGPPEPAVPPAAVADTESARAAHPVTPGGIDTEAIRRSWPDVLQRVSKISRVTWSLVSENATVLDYDGRRLLLGISTLGIANAFRGRNHAEVIRQALVEVLGVDATVEGRPSTPEDRLGGQGGHPSAGPPPPPAPAAGSPSDPGGGSHPDAPSRSPRRPGPAESSPGGRPSGATRPEDLGVAPSSIGRTDPGGEGWNASAAPPPDWATASGSASAGPARPERSERPDPAARHLRSVPSDGDASADDEDIEEAGAVGQPVIESVLGGTVIEERDQ